MKPTAVLVNTARGADQWTRRRSRWRCARAVIGAAGLDVTDPEPILPDDPLLDLDNCLIVPHIASATTATRGRMAEMAAANLLAGVRGEPLPTAVPPPGSPVAARAERVGPRAGRSPRSGTLFHGPVAQWQSRGLLIPGSRVRIPSRLAFQSGVTRSARAFVRP